MQIGIAIFAHGSAIESANDSVRVAVEEFRAASGFRLASPAFLELGKPDLAGAVADLVSQGAKRIVVVPYFLTLGKHLHRDLPRIVAAVSAAHPGIDIQVTPPLDSHPALAGILVDRVRQALESEE